MLISTVNAPPTGAALHALRGEVTMRALRRVAFRGRGAVGAVCEVLCVGLSVAGGVVRRVAAAHARARGSVRAHCRERLIVASAGRRRGEHVSPPVFQ